MGIDKMKVKKMCASCGICVAVCPFFAVTVKDIAIVDNEKCTKCGLCIKACPLGAIKAE